MATTPQTPKASPLVFFPFEPSGFLVPDPKTGRKSSKTFCNPLCNPDQKIIRKNPKPPYMCYPGIVLSKTTFYSNKIKLIRKFSELNLLQQSDWLPVLPKIEVPSCRPKTPILEGNGREY